MRLKPKDASEQSYGDRTMKNKFCVIIFGLSFALEVKSLPWLILTDNQHIVQAEGFNLDELDEKFSIKDKRLSSN